jgi:hypothetical protein
MGLPASPPERHQPMPDSMSARPKKAAGAARTAKGKRRSKNNNDLPADLAARLDIIREQYDLAMQHQRREAAFLSPDW